MNNKCGMIFDRKVFENNGQHLINNLYSNPAIHYAKSKQNNFG